MKKLFFYSLSLFLVLGIFSCKHKNKEDTPADTPAVQTTANQNTYTPVTDKEVLAEIVKAAPATNNEELVSSLNVDDLLFNNQLQDIMDLIDPYLNELSSKTSETKHQDYRRVRLDSGKFMIYNKKTNEFEPTVYTRFEDFVEEYDKYAAIVQIDGEDHFNILNGNLESIFQAKSIENFKQEDFTFYDKAQEYAVTTKALFAETKDDSGVVKYIRVNGNGYIYSAKVPNFDEDYMKLYDINHNGHCGTLSFHLSNVQMGQTLDNEVEKGYPVIREINKIQITYNNSQKSVTKKYPVCTVVSQLLNNLTEAATVTFTINGKTFTANYFH